MNKSINMKLRVFFPFAAGYFLSYLLRVVNAVIAPDLMSELHLGPADLGLLTSTYFVAFAAFQLPLGLLLDRFGPRRVETFLLLFAGIGALVFAGAGALPGLVAGRSLIGFGVSACLMAAFKAYVVWFPKEQLPLINGFQMAAGGLGALAGTQPVEASLALLGWRGVFIALGIITLMVAGAVCLVVPEKDMQGNRDTLREQLRGLGQVFQSPVFWRIAPLTTMSQAAFLSVQSLWVGPWLRDVAGMNRAEIAHVLLFTAAAMVSGFLMLGALAGWLGRKGVQPSHCAVAGMTVFMFFQVSFLMDLGTWALPIWIMFGFLGTTGILSYAALSQVFPAQLAGRVNTALNLLVFVAAFAAQWGIGVIIESWSSGAGGPPKPDGYRASFALLFVLQLLGLLWFVFSRPRIKRGSRAIRNTIDHGEV